MKKSQLTGIIRKIINEELELESQASDDAKRQGLTNMGFGRWGKDGKMTHKTVNGKLQPVKQDGGSAKPPAIGPSKKQDGGSTKAPAIGPSSPTTIGPSKFSGLFGKASDDELERGKAADDKLNRLIKRYKDVRQQSKDKGFGGGGGFSGGGSGERF
jgi:hypothetical protein